jgi:2-polyprenyl-6-methoxyphenol hydroxylase-like FAD-dependent oxidoreductase
MAETEVLVVGAGPTGLALALWLKAFGVHFRIIDKAREPGMTSRALAVHARTSNSTANSALPMRSWPQGR